MQFVIKILHILLFYFLIVILQLKQDCSLLVNEIFLNLFLWKNYEACCELKNQHLTLLKMCEG